MTSNFLKNHDPIFKLGIINLITSTTMTLYQGYLPIYLTSDVIVSILIFGIIVSSINLIQIFTRIPLGSLSQILGRRPMILFGTFLIDSSVILLYFANNFILVLVSAIFMAFGMSAYWPASFSYIQDINPNNYGRNNGRIFKMGDIGLLFGSLYAKIFLDQFLLSLRLFLLSLSLLGFFAFCLFYLILPEPLNQEHKLHTTISLFLKENFINMAKRFKEISTSSGMLKIYSVQFILAFTDYFLVIFFPLLLVSLNYSKGTLGMIIFGSTIALLWLKPYLGGIADRFGYRVPVLLSLSLVGIIFMITPYAKILPLLVLIYILCDLFIFIGYPAVNRATASTSSSTKTGLALGTLGVYTSSGRTTSTIIMSSIWKKFNINVTFISAGLFILLVCLLLFFFTKEKLVFESKDSFTISQSD